MLVRVLVRHERFRPAIDGAAIAAIGTAKGDLLSCRAMQRALLHESPQPLATRARLRRRRAVRALQLGLLAAGLAAFAWLLGRSDLALLWEQGLRLGPLGAASIVALGGLDQCLHALGWRRCFEPTDTPPLGALFSAHLAGNAVNLLTPTASVGGEFVRATLLPRPARGEAAVAAIGVDRLTFAVADGAIGACGVAVLVRAPELDGTTRIALASGIGLVLLGIGVFFALQRRGRLAALLSERRTIRRFMSERRAQALRASGSGIDRRIASVHAMRPGALAASTALHAAGSGMLIAQLACLLHFTGREASAGELVEIFAVVTALDLLAFFVPGRLGAQEGARMLGVTLAGLPAELGLLLSLAQRLEQGVWTSVGLALYARSMASSGPGPAPSEAGRPESLP